MKIIFSVLDRYDLWPHFRKHYQAQGVTQFVCVSYGPQLPGTLTVNAGITPCDFTGQKDALLHNSLIYRIIEPDEWFIIADLDEFAEVPNMSLREATQEAQSAGANHIRGIFYDRVTANGSIPTHLEDNIWQQFPLSTNATSVICGGWAEKMVAIHGKIPVNGGHHDVHETVSEQYKRQWPTIAHVHHFKWWGKDMARFFWTRTHEPGIYRVELQRLVQHFNQHQGLDLTILKQFE